MSNKKPNGFPRRPMLSWASSLLWEKIAPAAAAILVVAAPAPAAAAAALVAVVLTAAVKQLEHFFLQTYVCSNIIVCSGYVHEECCMPA